LKDTILKFLKLDSLIEHLTGFVETRIELMKVEVKEELVRVLSRTLVFLVILSVFTLFILLFSLAVSYKLGETLGNFGGFAIVAGFYLLIGLVVLAFREKIFARVERRLEEIMQRKKKKKI
jgi:ABC-type multidrug transport system fused ATPase/permease subunit